MRAERLFTIIGLVDEDLVEEAGTARSFKKLPLGVLGTCMAACLCLLVLSGGLWPMGGALKSESPAAGAEAAPGASAAAPSFLSYAGPMLPLLGLEGTELTAERALALNILDSRAEADDLYTLFNPTDHDISFTAYYPVAGSLGAIGRILPSITVDGEAVDTTLYAGQYAGGFISAYGSEDDSRRDNLRQPDTWDFYDKRLSLGDLDAALAASPVLEEPVTVYAFSDFTTRPDNDAATLAIEFTVDPSATTIMTYGFNGSAWDEDTGWRQYGFFVPNGRRMDTSPKLLILRGRDIQDYTIGGYTDGSCETPLEGLSCSVERYTATMGQVIEALCESYLEAYASGDNISGFLKSDPEQIPLDLFYRCAAELLTQYGPLSEHCAQRYEFGRLDEVVAEALILDRIFYTAFEVTVPAGGSVTVEAALQKAASFNFPGTERAGIEGYDLLTYTFPTALTVTGAEPAGGNFPLEKGTVELEPQRHYYFELTN